jgi:hypothetical protein
MTRDKLQRFLSGQRIIASCEDMDRLEGLDWQIAKRLVSIPNPERVGILDQYVAWLKAEVA